MKCACIYNWQWGIHTYRQSRYSFVPTTIYTAAFLDLCTAQTPDLNSTHAHACFYSQVYYLLHVFLIQGTAKYIIARPILYNCYNIRNLDPVGIIIGTIFYTTTLSLVICNTCVYVEVICDTCLYVTNI